MKAVAMAGGILAAVKEASRLNKIAAVWTAKSVVASAASAVAGAFSN